MSFYTFLPKLINMSLTASVVIALVLVARLLLKRAPKVISYALWSIVLIRLLCPVSIESNFSLFGLMDAPVEERGAMTSAIEYVPNNIVHTEYPTVALPVPGVSEIINDNLPQGEFQTRADPLEGPIFIATYVWIAGILGMAIYAAVSYLRLRRQLLTAIHLRDNIWTADEITSPFVMGLFQPKIYLPSSMEQQEQSYIILHEQHHIRRLDHIWKALAFVALCIHWFNPLVWVAFIMAGKDMEMSCDEAVVKKMGDGVLADYTASLLSLATGRHIIAGMPLAFGEGDTKGRIRNLANWRRPAFWIILVATVACVVLAACLLTNPSPHSYLQASDQGNHLEFSCRLENPIQSFAIYEDIYKDGELIFSEPRLMDNFVEEGGATPRSFDATLTATPIEKADGGYEGSLKLLWQGNAGAEWTLELPDGHYTNYATTLADGTHDMFMELDIEDDDDILLYSVLLATNPAGAITGIDLKNGIIKANDVVVQYRLVTSTGPLTDFQTTITEITSTPEFFNDIGKALSELKKEYPDGEFVVRLDGFPDSAAICFGEPETEYVYCFFGTQSGDAEKAMNECEDQLKCAGFVTTANILFPDMEDNMSFEDFFSLIDVEDYEYFGEDTTTAEGWLRFTYNGMEVMVNTNEAAAGGGRNVTGTRIVKRDCSVSIVDTEILNTNQDLAEPVMFDEEEDQEQPLTANAAKFPTEPVEFLFASGAGGWGTVLNLDPDGSFTGEYSDMDMGSATRYISEFAGNFSDIRQINDFTWTTKLDELTLTKEPGQTWSEDGIRHIASEPHGLTGGEEFTLYAPGTSADVLSDECRSWWPDAFLWRAGEKETIDGWCLCNVNTGHGFFS